MAMGHIPPAKLEEIFDQCTAPEKLKGTFDDSSADKLRVSEGEADIFKHRRL